MDYSRLEAKDGMTSYSQSWWRAFRGGEANREQAFHETLAEIARLHEEYRGQPNVGPLGVKEYLNSRVDVSWRKLYRAVESHWKKSGRVPK
jgi:hypothetical protein